VNKLHSLEKWLSWVDELSSKDFVVIDCFLTGDHYENVRHFFLSRLPAFSQAGIGALDRNTVNEQIRGDSTYWLDRGRDTELQPFWELVDEIIYIFNRYCFLSLSGYEFHFANYPPGGRYAKHLDQFQNRNNRIISVIIYLNEDWQPGDGGELEIFHGEQSTIVTPIKGRCVFFRSDTVPHSVLQSYKDRYSLTGWLLHQPASLGQFFG
jgi:SM-20-related protein